MYKNDIIHDISHSRKNAKEPNNDDCRILFLFLKKFKFLFIKVSSSIRNSF